MMEDYSHMHESNFIYYNPNPWLRATVGDCAIRAVAKATNQPWNTTYIALCAQGYQQGNLPNADEVWGSYLHDMGFRREVIPNECPNCYTVREFCEDHPEGTYVLGTGTHAVCVMDGCYYDVWDSGDTVPVFYWYLENA